jgi:3'(2'), 5'-bisphosphate nucleotidase
MESYLTIARDAARRAASLVMSYYGDSAFTEKADLSPVTVADRKAHECLIETLGKTGIPVLSEEGIHTPSTSSKRWVIDPIDGTRGFINGTGDFAVMIALLDEGRPVLGVIHVPVLDTQYYAIYGGGAFREKGGEATQLYVSKRSIPELRAVESLNHSAPYMQKVGEALEVVGTVKTGGIGIKTTFIIEDKGDYFLTLGNLGEWDVCAPEILLTEAGGRVTDRNGDPLYYNNSNSRISTGAVFSNGSCHREVLTALMLSTRPQEQTKDRDL